MRNFTSLFEIVIFLILFISCSNMPRNFTYKYTGIDAGLANRIAIDGYYVANSCDTSLYTLLSFYPDGQLLSVTTSLVSEDLIDCLKIDEKSTLCENMLWGLYVISGDTIKTQTLRKEGTGCVIFRDFLINPDSTISYISDYVEPQYTLLGYMKNYPGFLSNPCNYPVLFYPIAHKRSLYK